MVSNDIKFDMAAVRRYAYQPMQYCDMLIMAAARQQDNTALFDHNSTSHYGHEKCQHSQQSLKKLALEMGLIE